MKQGTALEIDRHRERSLHKENRKVLDREKSQFLNKEISEASGRKSLFRSSTPFSSRSQASSYLAILLCLDWWNGSAATSPAKLLTSVLSLTPLAVVILLLTLLWTFLLSPLL